MKCYIRNTNKTTVIYYFMLIKMVIIQKTLTSVGEDAEKLEPSYTAVEIVKWVLCPSESIWQSL